jgi:PAS domain S-box-containing protein
MQSEESRSELLSRIESLERQVTDLQSALRESEHRFRTLSDFAPVGIYLDNADGRATYINKKCGELVGVPAEELLDFNWVTALHEDDRERVVDAWKRAFEHKEPFKEEYRYVHPDGTIVWTLGEVVPLPGKDGNATRFVGSLTDITSRKEIESRLMFSLEEKEILLQELYHRINNSLQLIRSMLLLQASAMPDNAQAQRLVVDTENRVMAMALVHQRLYLTRDLSRIPMDEYVHDLLDLFLRNLASERDITTIVDTEPLSLLIDAAIPCGMILYELIASTIHHAFPDNQRGSVTVRLSRDSENRVVLFFTDDGVGVATDFASREQTTLGLQTIYAIAEQQLGGTAEFSAKHGVRWSITFPDSLHTERV